MLKIAIAVAAIVGLAGPAQPMICTQSGCCSHHEGVCSCSGGRKKCCDGTLSPSCTC